MKPLFGAIAFVAGAFAFGTIKANEPVPEEPMIEVLNRVEATLGSLDHRVTTLEQKNGGA
jgi:hypothetical protein